MRKILLGAGLLTAALVIGLFTKAGIVRAVSEVTPLEYDYDFITYDGSMHGGKWAVDYFSSKVKLTPTEGDCYTYERTDGGTFETTGDVVPAGDGSEPIVAGIKGDISGGISGTICGTLREDISNDEPEDLRGAEGSYAERYFGHFLTDISGFTISDWGWTYTSCGNGTWTDTAETESAWKEDKDAMGNISGEEYVACETPSTGDNNYTPWTPPKSIPTAPQCHDMKPSLGVANVNVVRTSDTTALVQWSLHSGDQTHIIFGEAGTGWHHAALNVGTSGEAVINELIPGRTYDWAVIPMNGCAAAGLSPIVYGI